MRIQPTQQHTNNTCYSHQKMNFKGEFVRTKPLQELMMCSDIGGLKRFKELVNEMKEVKDNLIFWVERIDSEYEIHNGSDTEIDVSYYLHKQSEQNEKTNKKLTCIYEDIPSSSKLSKINEALEKFYKNDILVEDRNNLINGIDELLIRKDEIASKSIIDISL